MRVKVFLSWLNIMIITLILCTVLEAKVLIVVDSDYYYTYEGNRHVNRYAWDVNNIDKIPAEIVIWDWKKEDVDSIRKVCYPLWQTLQQKYMENLANPALEQLTGAVFIGDLPIPKFSHVAKTTIKCDTTKHPPKCDTSYEYYEYPHDYYFMDLFNQKTGTFFSTASITLHNKINFESNSLTYKYI